MVRQHKKLVRYYFAHKGDNYAFSYIFMTKKIRSQASLLQEVLLTQFRLRRAFHVGSKLLTEMSVTVIEIYSIYISPMFGCVKNIRQKCNI